MTSRLLARRRASSADSLTERELGVLARMAEGLTKAGIAEKLVITERTVETHVRHVLSKLDVPQDAHRHRRVLAVLAHLRSG